jgi:phosphoglycolate phosphatase-like HAD superfamily hydrolase
MEKPPALKKTSTPTSRSSKAHAKDKPASTMKFRTLVFDFDGTIADTLGETRKIFNELAPGYGIRQVAEHEVEKLRHLSLKQLLDHLEIPKRRVPSLIARGTSILRGSITRLDLIQGMSEVLTELRVHVESFGILTSNTPENVDLFLRGHGLREIFDFISSTSKLTGKSKHLKAIRKTFSLRAEEMLYVGDELRDVKASQKAGIPIAAVTWGFNSRESLAAEKPDFIFDQPKDFMRLLKPH